LKEPGCHPETLTYIIIPFHKAPWHPELGSQLFTYHADDCRINDKNIIYIELPSANPGPSTSLLLETGHIRTVKKGLIFSVWKLQIILFT